MSRTPYSTPDPQKTPYDDKGGLSRKLRHGRPCPACGSRNTVRDFYKDEDLSCRGCALEACLFPIELLLAPVFFVFAIVYRFSKKRRENTCHDCTHHWRSYW